MGLMKLDLGKHFQFILISIVVFSASLYVHLLISSHKAKEKLEKIHPNLVYFPPNNNQKIFPNAWYETETAGSYEYLGGVIKPKLAIITIQMALEKYPSSLVSKYLEKIYVVNKLNFYDVAYGGTNSSSNIYLSFNFYTPKDLEEIFHAEFSSILLRQNQSLINYQSWKDNNPKGFKYSGNPTSFIKDKKSYTINDEELYNSGFINEYATTTFENDFNNISRILFCNDKRFWEDLAGKRFSGLNNKINIVIDFYSQLNRVFNLEYFRKLKQCINFIFT